MSKPPLLPTPSTSHIPDCVYPPSEDSFLLLDSIHSDSEFLTRRFPPSTPPPLISEFGVGSGVVLGFVLSNAGVMFGRQDVLGFGVDANQYACKAASQTAELAIKETTASQDAVIEQASSSEAKPSYKTKPTMVGTIQADLGTAIRDGKLDVIFFNPPYMATDTLPPIRLREFSDEERNRKGSDVAWQEESHFLELAVAGGDRGMETTDRFLSDIPRLLSSRGVFYLLLGAANRPHDVKDSIERWEGGWKVDWVGDSGKTGGWEKLKILRAWRECMLDVM